jgi:hypothetical protein
MATLPEPSKTSCHSLPFPDSITANHPFRDTAYWKIRNTFQNGVQRLPERLDGFDESTNALLEIIPLLILVGISEEASNLWEQAHTTVHAYSSRRNVGEISFSRKLDVTLRQFTRRDADDESACSVRENVSKALEAYRSLLVVNKLNCSSHLAG